MASIGISSNRQEVGAAPLIPTSNRVAAISGCSTSVAVTPPAADLATRVANAPAGTCFTLANGVYTFHDVVPKNSMTFVGESTTGVVVDGRGHENAFHGTADRVTIARMTFQDFNSSAGTKRQEQSPIRGTARLWASDPGQMATNWVIDGVISQRNYAAGIFVGDHFTVRNSTFRNNGVTGLSGDSFVGGLFENNIVHGNGALQNSGVEVNGGGMKFGQAGSLAAPVVIRNNEVYDNPNIGIWCDIGCQGFHVIDNYIHDHVSRGVMYELSANLVVRGNRVERSNTWTNHLGDFNAGAITVGESKNAVVENNHIQDAQSGVVVRQTRRPATGEGFLANYPYVNYVTSNVTVRNNVHVRVRHTGISTGSTGNGLITNPGSITYTGNSYDDLAGMTFWWNNGQRLTAAQWQAAGRDTSANGSGPSTGAGDRGPDQSTATAPSTSQPPATSPPTPSPTRQPVSVPVRINAGGPAFVDADGARWIADDYYVGGNTAFHAAGKPIANTESDSLYRDERWGATGYDIPVPAGRYLVRLHHAEVYEGCQIASCRTFSVTVEGETVVADVDVYSTVGGYSALVVDTVSAVGDGELTIRFSSSRQSAQVSGIEILPATAASTTTGQPTTGSMPTSPLQTDRKESGGSIGGVEGGAPVSGLAAPDKAAPVETTTNGVDSDDSEPTDTEAGTDAESTLDGTSDPTHIDRSSGGLTEEGGGIDPAFGVDAPASSQLALELVSASGDRGTSPFLLGATAVVLTMLAVALGTFRSRQEQMSKL